MTNDTRALCAELVAAWDDLPWEYDFKGNVTGIHGDLCDDSAVDRARALLAQPAAEEPTDDEIEEWADACPEAPLEEMDPEVHGWRRCFTAKEFSETIRAAIARWGNSQGILDSSPQPVWADIHYVWTLEDADGEWQAGGSANSLEDVQREGNRYLQTYSQDGPHKLIIQRHCVSTIEEAHQ